MGWTVMIDAAGGTPDDVTDAHLCALLGELDEHAGVVTGTPVVSDCARYGAVFSIDDPALSPVEALAAGVALFERAARRGALPWFPVVRAEVMTFAEHDRAGS